LASAGAELFITPHVTFIAKFDGEFAPRLADLRRQRHAPLFVAKDDEQRIACSPLPIC